jgi:hypothetical protein
MLVIWARGVSAVLGAPESMIPFSPVPTVSRGNVEKLAFSYHAE